MKKYLFILIMSLVAGMATQAQPVLLSSSPWAGNPLPEESGSYFLYNVETGLWFQHNRKDLSKWTTHAQADVHGMDVTISKLDDGGYQIDPRFGHNQSLNGTSTTSSGYMDTSAELTPWEFTPSSVVDKGFEISCDGGNGLMCLDWVEDEAVAPKPIWGLNFVMGDGVTWQLVTKEERLADLEKATMDAPKDATWLISGWDFAAADERNSAWINEITDSGSGVAFNQGWWCNRAAEVWSQGSGDYYQVITGIPNGTYGLTVQGFYRDGSTSDVFEKHESGTEVIRARYFANDVYAPFMSICDNGVNEEITDVFSETYGFFGPGDGGNALPHASNAFYLGYYQNKELKVTVTDGTLRIGVRKNSNVSDDWLVFDNFNLTYYGPAPEAPWSAPAEPILDESGAEIRSGELYYLKNVGAGQFLTGANSWSTQISLTSAGYKDAKNPPLIIQVVDTTIVLSGTSVSGYAMKVYGSQKVNGNNGERIISNTLLFRDSEESGYIDYNNQGRGCVWNITKRDGYYRIRTADGDAAYENLAYQYAGWYDWNGPIEVDWYGNLISGETTVNFACWVDPETGALDDESAHVDWLFIPVARYQEQMKVYEAREALYECLQEAQELEVSTQEAETVYNNEQATVNELVAATDALKAAINQKVFANAWADASEENPIEITDDCLQNADFNQGNINGWICTFVTGTTATNIGYQSASYSIEGEPLTGSAVNDDGEAVSISQFIEAWSQSTFNNGVVGDGELYQKVYGLPVGTYSLTCDAIAVDQYKGNNPVTGVEIFIATETGLESAQAIATKNGSPEHFSVKFVSDGSSVITFGLRTRGTTANWIAADNFHVFFYGKAASVGAIYLKTTMEACVIEEIGACNAEVKAAYTAAWTRATELVEDNTSDSDVCVKQAEVLKEAYRALLASIEDYKVVPSILEDCNQTLEVLQTLNKAALEEQASAFIQALSDGYTNGTLTKAEIEAAQSNFKSLISEGLTANMQAGDDLTLLITNPTFDTNGTGWNLEGNATVNYNYGTAEVYHQSFDFYQVIPSVAAGVYRLSCTAFNRLDGNVRTAKIYGGISEERLKLLTDEGSTYALLSDTEEEGADGNVFASSTGTWPYDSRVTNVAGAEGEVRFIPYSMQGANIYFNTINPATQQPYYSVSTQIVLPEKGDLRIGIKGESSTEWVLWDNFKLEYVGSSDDMLADYVAQLKPYLATDVYYMATLRQDATAKVTAVEGGNLTAEEAYNIIGSIGNLIDDIKTSIEAYTILGDAITNAEDQLASTENAKEDVKAELQSLLAEAKEAYAAGSYTDAAAKSVAIRLNALSSRLQSGYLYIEMATAGTLNELVLDQVQNLSDVKGLIVTGPMNSNDMAIVAQMTSLRSLDLTDAELARIESYQFQDNDTLETVRLPKTLTYIGYEAFYDCDGLTSVTIAGNITSDNMGGYLFYSCDKLEEVIIEEGITAISYEMFEYCNRLSKLTLPQSLTSIGSNAFYNCYSLSDIPLPSKLQTIGNYAFFRDNTDGYIYNYQGYYYDDNGNYHEIYDTIANQAPKYLEIPASVVTIGTAAFHNLRGLESVKLNEGLSIIGSRAFYGTKITTATFPSTLTSVGGSVFNNGTHYTSLSLTPPTANNGCPVEKPDTLYVPMLSVKAYKQATGWDKFKIVGTDILPDDITVKKQMTLDFADANVPEGYNPNITIWHTNVSVSSSSSPTTLGALEIRNAGQFTPGLVTHQGYNHAQANYYKYNWGSTFQQSVMPQSATLISDGTMHADNIDITMSLTDGYWNFISVPYDVRVGDITCETAEAQWVIRRYDGEARAAGNLNNTWVNLTKDDILEAGKGYILHCTYQQSMSRYIVFHFPALNNENKNLIFSAADRTIALGEYLSETANNRGWNLIGNPYPAYIEIGSTDFDAPITVWNGRSGYWAYSPYDDNYVLAPGEAFFVQRPANKTGITFSADARQSYYDVKGTNNYVKGIRQTNSERHVFNLFLSDGEHSDRTRVVINPAATMDYETERDAAKFPAMDATATQLYSIANGVQYAINERPLADGSVQLAAHFGQTGTFTFSLDTKATESVILIDEATGLTTELNGTEGYTFTAQTGTSQNRFRLQIGAVETGIENLAADYFNGADVFTLDGKKIAGKPSITGVYLVKKNGTVRKVSVK